MGWSWASQEKLITLLMLSDMLLSQTLLTKTTKKQALFPLSDKGAKIQRLKQCLVQLVV